MESERVHPQSAPGRYWVDCQECLDHSICADIAPHNFQARLQDGPSCYFVYKQPETEQEERQCREALRSCPMGAIHDDGTPPAA